MKLGGNHPYTVSVQNRLEIVLKKVRAQLGRLVGKPDAQGIAQALLKALCSMLQV